MGKKNPPVQQPVILDGRFNPLSSKFANYSIEQRQKFAHSNDSKVLVEVDELADEQKESQAKKKQQSQIEATNAIKEQFNRLPLPLRKLIAGALQIPFRTNDRNEGNVEVRALLSNPLYITFAEFSALAIIRYFFVNLSESEIISKLKDYKVDIDLLRKFSDIAVKYLSINALLAAGETIFEAVTFTPHLNVLFWIALIWAITSLALRLGSGGYNLLIRNLTAYYSREKLLPSNTSASKNTTKAIVKQHAEATLVNSRGKIAPLRNLLLIILSFSLPASFWLMHSYFSIYDPKEAFKEGSRCKTDGESPDNTGSHAIVESICKGDNAISYTYRTNIPDTFHLYAVVLASTVSIVVFLLLILDTSAKKFLSLVGGCVERFFKDDDNTSKDNQALKYGTDDNRAHT